jgi:TolB-like protein/Tfp pilus assembly protein PilF
MAGAGWFAWQRGKVGTPRTTLAVLPFKPLLDDGRDKRLEVGMADSLTARLSVVPGLVVRSTASALRYAGPTQDPVAAARDLDVDWVVDGTLLRHGDQLRATARLLRTADGSAAWSGSFDAAVSDVFAVQDQIGARVAQALAGALSLTGLAQPAELGGTRKPEAYQLYLAATWRAQGTRGDSTAKALALLQQALAIDPACARAWAQRAWVRRRRLWRNDSPASEVFAASNDAARRALSLAPELGLARAGLAFSLYWFEFDWSAAQREFRAAVASNPNEVSAHWGMAQLLLSLGRVDEGFAHLRLTLELDPMSPVFHAIAASYLTAHGRLAVATTRLTRAFDIAPEHGLAYEALALLRLAEGRPDEALAAQRKSVDSSDGTTHPLAMLGRQLAIAGHEDESRAILQRLEASAGVRFVPPTCLATVQAALGHTAAALDALEEAYRVRDVRLIYL